MATCVLCQKNLGLFSKKSKRDGNVLCKGCLLEYEVRQNDALIQGLYSNGEPKEYVLLTRVKVLKFGSERLKVAVRGALALLDRGVVFLEISRFNPRSQVAVISAQISEKAEKEYDYAADRIFEGAMTLKEILERTPRLYLYPIDQISNMKCTRFGPKLRFRHGKYKLEFHLGLVLEEDEEVLQQYVAMVNS